MEQFVPKQAIPRHGAVHALCDELISFLIASRAKPGVPFQTGKSLCESTGLSYGTVRKALDVLSREGWIEGRPGRGMFVGPRVETPVVTLRSSQNGNRQQLRVAVMSNARLSVRHWFLHEFLEGLESAAQACAISVELLSYRLDRLDSARQRLAQSRPDVVVAVIPHMPDVRLVGEAERLGIPCLVAGMRCPELGIPNVYEDGQAAIEEAIRDLAAKGHRRIGFIEGGGLRHWYMADRLRHYRNALAASGIEPDANLILQDLGAPACGRELFSHFLSRAQPTAILCGASWLAQDVASLAAGGQCSIPDRLSVVIYDQDPDIHSRFGMRVAHIAQPLREEGQRAAQLARAIAKGNSMQADVMLPSRYVAGESVAEADAFRKGDWIKPGREAGRPK